MDEKSISPSVEKWHRISYYPGEEPVLEVFRFKPDSITLLTSFLAYIDEWYRLGISPSALSSSFSFYYKKGEETRVESNPPNSIQLAALHSALRPFVLQKEPTYFFKVLKLLATAEASEQFNSLMKAFSNRYKGKGMSFQINFAAGGERISYEAIFQHWLNGFVYHRDENSRKLISSFESIFPRSALRAHFGMLFVDRAMVIGQTGILVRAILADDPARLTNVK